MKFENAFSRPGKILMDFRENSRGHGKVLELNFLVEIFRVV